MTESIVLQIQQQGHCYNQSNTCSMPFQERYIGKISFTLILLLLYITWIFNAHIWPHLSHGWLYIWINKDQNTCVFKGISDQILTCLSATEDNSQEYKAKRKCDICGHFTLYFFWSQLCIGLSNSLTVQHSYIWNTWAYTHIICLDSQ